jgi:hypothetical protein
VFGGVWAITPIRGPNDKLPYGGRPGSQVAVWMNEDDGILPMLCEHHEDFEGVSLQSAPHYTAVLRIIDRLLTVRAPAAPRRGARPALPKTPLPPSRACPPALPSHSSGVAVRRTTPT